ncbi:tetratricopeptide repeat protein [Sulfitobacter mediterraneus]|uniref:tetratricopeptide repeat protein n=1 Tax=Sulfitobacter mediterraneus TaxID=83219 RepID=UPI00193ABDAB|nr:tetratricopeptide repeat protein [Sulfitobacter mediterraneus]MBM1566099.1 tetratricopeptide repeat protein [Sulfitobacter mediterraneus]
MTRRSKSPAERYVDLREQRRALMRECRWDHALKVLNEEKKFLKRQSLLIGAAPREALLSDHFEASGECFFGIGKTDMSIKCYLKSLQYVKELSDKPEYHEAWARISANLALSLTKSGRPDEALAAYHDADRLISESPHLKGKVKYDSIRARLAANMADLLSNLKLDKEALSQYRKATRLYEESPALKGRRKYESERAKLSVMMGSFLDAIGQSDDAFNAHLAGESLFSSGGIVNRHPRAIHDKALLLANRGSRLLERGKVDAAIEACKEAWKAYSDKLLADRLDLNAERASLSELLGLCHVKLGQSIDALEAFDRAVLLTQAGILSPREIAITTKVYSSAACLLPARNPADAEKWVWEASARLSSLLDLEPVQIESQISKEIHRLFQLWHARCLNHVLQNRSRNPTLVFNLLLALQGRRLIAEVMDEALSIGISQGIDKRVIQLAQSRRELRKLMTSLHDKAYKSAIQTSDVEPGPEGMDYEAFSSFTSRGLERSEADRVKYNAARTRYEAQKAAAAKAPGYEFLGDPVKGISLERLQAGLREDELLVLAFLHGDTDEDDAESKPNTYLWALRKNSAPRLFRSIPPLRSGKLLRTGGLFGWLGRHFVGRQRIDQPLAVSDLAALFSRAGASLGAARGGVRKSPDRPGADKPDPLPEAMLGTVWSELERGMRQLIWTPLEANGALEGVSQVTVCTMGAFHNLPVASGAPEGLTVRSAGALPIFALTRGLYAGPGNGAVAPTRPTAAVEAPVALLSDDAASDDIPQTRVEIAASQWLWERARGGAVIRASGVPFAEAEGPVARLAHTPCHGDVDTSVTPPLPVLGLGGGVTERDLVGRPVVEGWMFMSCVVGQNFDDLIEGTPVGLVNGALRNGAGTVVAFISPVPDAIGMLTGLTITAQVSQRGTPLGAAADHARRVLDPTHPEDDPELMRLVAEALASHRVEDFAKQLAGGVTPGELQGDVAEVDRLWTDFAGLAEALAGAASPPSAAELTPLLARHIHPRIPAETPEDQLRLGVLQHALVVFEGYRQG